MQSTRKTRWQQATALVSLSTCGTMTGLSFAHGTAADLTSPSNVPVKLMALTKPAAASDSELRAAIVKAARYYLSLAHSRSPSAMESLIWQNDSTDGADHGESCAAFASLALESGAQATGQRSWVTGGTSYPWPVHAWVDSRVDPNPGSPGIISILQDAQAHGRWHPIGDGYRPQPGDWVLFDQHVEVVTKYAGGVLSTIGGDSMPNLSVNAHQYVGPLGAQGVTGFVNNGVLVSAVSRTTSGAAAGGAASAGAALAESDQGQADIPGVMTPALAVGGLGPSGGGLGPSGGGLGPSGGLGQAAGQREAVTAADAALTAKASIPGAVPISGSLTSYSSYTPAAAGAGARYSRSRVETSGASAPDSPAQQAFIAKVAPGALAAQRQYGIPASVTIAQAIDESGWGQSLLATQDNNLFGIKGTGPAGSVVRSTQEFQNGQDVTINAPFRVYDSVAQSISDHTLLLATGSSYKQAMSDRRSPDAFANDLTGVYATDPNYGGSLITIMRQYNLYRFDAQSTAAQSTGPASGGSGAAVAAAAPAAPGGSAGQSAMADIPGTVAMSASGTGQAASGQAARSATKLRPVVRQSAGVQDGLGAEGSGGASIPGLDEHAGTAASASASAAAAADASTSSHVQPMAEQALRAGPRNVHVSTRRYVAQMPRVVLTDFVTTAKIPLLRAKPVYQQVAAAHHIGWQLLAACDWMQCQAQPGSSPVYGEPLGTKNADGTIYRTKADALDQCAADLIELAALVYGINLRHRRLLSVRDLANVFAAFRWGGLLKAHRISAMAFPYSVEGLSAAHVRMRWPDIGQDAPDKPGTRFRMSFGAVPVALRLDYPAIA